MTSRTKYHIVYSRKHIWSPPTWVVVNQYGEELSRHVTKKLAEQEIRALKHEQTIRERDLYQHQWQHSQWGREADRIDGYDRDDLGESYD